jgi:hypothetical protein
MPRKPSPAPKWSRIARVIGPVLLLGACASFGPEDAALSISKEDVRRTDTPAAGETRWDYVLVITNPNRLPATLFQATLSLGWDGVRTLPENDRTLREVPPRGALRLPKSTVFRLSDFEASSPGAPGRPLGAPHRTDTMWIYWQFLGRHAGGSAIILNFDFFPDRK